MRRTELAQSFCSKHTCMHLKTDVPLMYEKAAGRRAGRGGLSGLKEEQGDLRNRAPLEIQGRILALQLLAL